MVRKKCQAYTGVMDHKPDDSTPPPKPEWQTSPSDMANMSNFVPPVKPRNILGLLLKVLAVIVLLAILAAVLYWIFTRPKSSPPNHSNATGQQQVTKSQPQTPKDNSALITSSTKQYSSPNFNLAVTYPEDWAVSDITGSNKLTITSPALKLIDASGQPTSGKIMLTIQPKQTKLGQFSAGSAVAALQSQRITYINPTPNQRAQTYVSFLSYATTKSNSALDALYVTGDIGYQKGQEIPESDVVQADPLVTISFQKCADSQCSTGQPMSIAASSWSNNQLSGPVLSILKSLVLQ